MGATFKCIWRIWLNLPDTSEVKKSMSLVSIKSVNDQNNGDGIIGHTIIAYLSVWVHFNKVKMELSVTINWL